jgi:hypothetical protein
MSRVEHDNRVGLEAIVSYQMSIRHFLVINGRLMGSEEGAQEGHSESFKDSYPSAGPSVRPQALFALRHQNGYSWAGTWHLEKGRWWPL